MISEQQAAYDYFDSGSGPVVLLLPGSFSTGSAWKAVLDSLGEGLRTVTTGLLGYGSKADKRPDGNATTSRQVEWIDRILERIGAPAHGVVHSYAGLSALAHALSGRPRPLSLLLVQANPLGLLRAAGDLEHYRMFKAMTGPYFAAFARGEPDAPPPAPRAAAADLQPPSRSSSGSTQCGRGKWQV